jgi:hypothetical protein
MAANPVVKIVITLTAVWTGARPASMELHVDAGLGRGGQAAQQVGRFGLIGGEMSAAHHQVAGRLVDLVGEPSSAGPAAPAQAGRGRTTLRPDGSGRRRRWR